MFKAGDVVMLKSSGPKMTVQRLIGDDPKAATIDERSIVAGFKKGDPICQWFVGSTMTTHAFGKETLEPAS